MTNPLPATQDCPHHPFGHTWDSTATTCSLCSATRTASEATVSVLASLPGWDHEKAEHLINHMRTEIGTGA